MSEIRVNSCENIEELTEKLMQIFSGDKVNVDEVIKLFSAYKSNQSDWEKFAIFDSYKYTRNLVHRGNGKYNLMILCWGENMGSSVHDHANAHCFVKILSGKLKETLYEWPDPRADVGGSSKFGGFCNDRDEDCYEGKNPLKQRAVNVYEKDQVTYINDEIGLHRMENPSHTDSTVTLHLYCPPFKACHTFDERTGKTRECPMTFWSEFGKKLDYRKTLGNGTTR